jgi:hypothetical protein
MSEFVAFPKMGRLTRDCVVTEKIDGTNAQIYIAPMNGHEATVPPLLGIKDGLALYAGSRTRWITPSSDNFGFATWVCEHLDELFALGEGRHYGEWWGSGVQRGYGLTEKRLSLFNVARWADDRDREKFPSDRPACCGVVPVLYRGLFSPNVAENMIAKLAHEGSVAAPGFMKPEGIVIFHTAIGTMFKKTIEQDEQPKGKAA